MESPYIHYLLLELSELLAFLDLHIVQAAGLLLRQWLASAEKGKSLLGIHPVSGRVAEQGQGAVAVASLKALQAFAKVKSISAVKLEIACILHIKYGKLGMQRSLLKSRPSAGVFCQGLFNKGELL